MTETVFLLGIHNHQPVGNFPEIFELGYQKSYMPFLDAIKHHPKIRWSLHLSGILWDFMVEKHPEYIKQVKKMVDNGLVEILSGGYYEPILAVIPDRDKVGQIKKLNDFIKNNFGQTPKGLWLTERIWEPSLPKILNDSGIEYTLVDDYHFLSAGYEPDTLRGYYVTEDEGCKLNIFPISQKLRYYIPFEAVEKSLELFKNNLKYHSSLTMGDDGEKFGMWPQTHEHVYGVNGVNEKSGSSKNGWLSGFFNALDSNENWLKTMSFSEFIASHQPSGRVYLPSASYFEMSEWTLPAARQLELEAIVSKLQSSPTPDGHVMKKFLRGGFWRGFLTKYTEANNMHKKMLYVSSKIFDEKGMNGRNKVTSSIALARKNKAVDHLYAAQCNCAYWHGVFGGLYLPHLRKAVYEELIKSEKSLGQKKTKIKMFDINKDGREELIYESPTQNLYFAPSYGGCLYEWDILNPPVNVLNVITRRYEAYHQKLRQDMSKVSSNSLSIHGMVKSKEKNLAHYLNYEWYNRATLLDHFLRHDTKYDNFYRSDFAEQGDFVIEPYELKIEGKEIIFSRTGTVWLNNISHAVKVEKRIKPVSPGKLVLNYKITNLSNKTGYFNFAIESNMAFFSNFGKVDEQNNSCWEQTDKVSGMNFIYTSDMPSTLWCMPIETVSLSEGGFERTLQGGCIVRLWTIELAQGESKEIIMNFEWT